MPTCSLPAAQRVLATTTMNLIVLWCALVLPACVDVRAADTPERPDGSSCEEALVWSEFYESCVTACPATSSYDNDGLCVTTPA